MSENARTPHLLLRLAVAFAFLYPPISAYLAPYDWIGYFPHFMRGILPDTILLSAWGLLEITIALWILSNKRIFIPSVLATLLLVSIVLFNLQQFEVVFRDLALAFITVYLAHTSFSPMQHS